MVRRIIRDYWEGEHLKCGYQLVFTPHIARGALWEVSGHMDYYAENMYTFEKEGKNTGGMMDLWAVKVGQRSRRRCKNKQTFPKCSD